jgi:hypothetical protein
MGFLIVDMTTTVTSERFHDRSTQKDQIVLDVKLQRGGNASLALHRVRAKLVSLTMPEETITRDFESLARVISGDTKSWDYDTDNPHIRLPPGEGTHFSTVVPVDPSKAYFIEISVQGKRLYSTTRSQWKATTVSVPESWDKVSGSTPNKALQPTALPPIELQSGG